MMIGRLSKGKMFEMLNFLAINWAPNHFFKKLFSPFLSMGFNCPKATTPMQGDSFLFINKVFN